MKLSHFSNDPIEDLQYKHQIPSTMKPVGFWISVDGPDDWPSWCAAEQFRECDKQLRYDVRLKEKNGVLVIEDGRGMVAFNDRYGQTEREVLHSIDWQAVAKEYDGLIIAPYQWEYRLANGFLWYYGWDCASGCIWNPEAIASIELAQERIAA